MPGDDEEAEALTREALEILQRLSAILPLAIKKARAAGARDAAQRLARLAVEFPNEDVEPAQERPPERTSKRAGRGEIADWILKSLEAAGQLGAKRVELRDEAVRSSIARSSFFMALERLSKERKVVERDGRLFLAHFGSSPPSSSLQFRAGATSEADSQAVAPAHNHNQEGSRWTRPS
jgi:hypothetical protein